MILTLDNADGRGAVDYSATLLSQEGGGLTIQRALNQSSTLDATLCLAGTPLTTPVRKARVVVASDAGAVLFTGYLTTEPVAEYLGVACAGPVYRLALRAVSDEWLLDRLSGRSVTAGTVALALGSPAGPALALLVSRLGGTGFTTGGIAAGPALGVLAASPGASWSGAAGALAAAGYGAYRVLNGAVALTTAGSVTHALSDGDGSLEIAALHTAQVRELANDITVSGAMEPAAYWTELFLGDGATMAFPLTGEPDAVDAGHAVLLVDGFAEPALDTTLWSLTDPGAHLALGWALGGGVLGGGGLVLNGGNGLDGQTTLAALAPVELGGTLLLELDRVVLNPASAGVLGGLYEGTVQQANCFAGFSVSQSGGNTVVTPIVNGTGVGTTFTIVEGHQYTLRLHAHCAELLRVRQAYYAAIENPGGGFSVGQFGGGLVSAPMALVFEIRDLGLSSNTGVTVLYDGAVASSPASCTLVAANSVQLFGSVGQIRLTRTGSAWVTLADPVTGQMATQLVGVAGQGVDCRIGSSDPVTGGAAGTATVTFFAGRTPPPNARMTVSYRGRQRAVARMADAASVAAETAGGAPGTSRWLGKVLEPPARSTQDCEAAAAAILSFAADRSAAVAGSCTVVNPMSLPTGSGIPNPDLWPGDALSVTANGGAFSGILRKVTIAVGSAAPEVLRYSLAFANDWAEGLGLTLSESIAADAVLPATAVDSTVPETARVLANLQQMTVPATVGTGASLALQVDAGQDAPAGGGFEVRRRNGGFGAGATGFAAGDLVLRSPVRGFQIPIAQAGEQFFVRLYDGSVPPLYSRASAAIVSQVPVVS